MKIKDGAFVINLDEYVNVGTYWIAQYMLSNDGFNFDSFGVKHLSKEIRPFIGNKNMQTNIFRIKADIFAFDFWTVCLQVKL